MNYREKAVKSILDLVEFELKKVEYGNITIELKGFENKIDIITQKRQRIQIIKED